MKKYIQFYCKVWLPRAEVCLDKAAIAQPAMGTVNAFPSLKGGFVTSLK